MSRKTTTKFLHHRASVNFCLNAQMSTFGRMGETIDTPEGPLTYIDNGASILAVAHLDSVNGNRKPRWKGDTVRCIQLDDRLGAWVILSQLPSIGCVPFDILLTDSEEKGMSTASHFMPKKDYNWIFQFDREGTDCVMYEYEDDYTISAVEQHGFQVGWGSFSDICSLEHLGVKGFNFGTGYLGQHTDACRANLRDTVKSAQMFTRFASEYSGIKMEHKKEDEWYWQDTECQYCRESLDDSWTYCPYCGQMIYSQTI